MFICLLASRRNGLLLTLQTGLCILNHKFKKNLIEVFQAIQSAVFHKKNESKMFQSNSFMFLDLLVSCDKNKI